VVFSQNHDQVGNRMKGDRLSTLVSFSALKLAAACTLLSPFIPLLFMGEEYGETAHFPYFVSHTDEGLVQAVREGRRREFAGFQWDEEPPDPQDEKTFVSAKLVHSLRHQPGNHRMLYAYYRELIQLRREIDAFALLRKDHMEITGDNHHQVLFVRCRTDTDEVFLVLSFNRDKVSVIAPLLEGRWVKRLDSHDPKWGGAGVTVPDHVTSGGETSLTLHDHACILFYRNKENK
jgi:maltooligosyltrehalose trehalohydrolase